MSVFVKDRLLALGGSSDDALVNHPGFGYVELTVGDIRKEGLGIVLTPVDDTPLGQSHADVYCKKTGSKRSHLRDACKVIVEPQDLTQLAAGR